MVVARRVRTPTEKIDMRSNERGFGAYVGVTAFLALVLVLQTKRRWNELGMVDRSVVSLIWISLLASIAAIAVTIWRYIKVRRARANGRSND